MATSEVWTIPARVRQVAPRWLRRSYAAKFSTGFVVVLLVIGAMGGLIYLESSQELATVTESRLESNSELQGMVLSQWVEKLEGEARRLSGSATVRGGSLPLINSFLNSKIKGNSLPAAVVAIHYVDDSTGVARTYTPENWATKTPAGDQPWRDVDLGLRRESVTTVTDPYESPVTGRPAIAVVSTVPGMDERAIVLVVDLKSQITTLPRAGTGATTVVVDDAGTVVMSHDAEDILSQNRGPAGTAAVESVAVENALKGETGYVELDHYGTPMAIGYAPVDGTNWAIVTREPVSSAFALRQDVLSGLLALLAAAILGLGAIGLTLGKGTIDSLNALSGRAAALEAGDLDADLDTDREDEIGDLYAAFDSMRVSLRETIDEAETARERAEAERARSQALVDHLEEKAEAYRETMRAMADGDFTRRMDQESESEAMAEIGETFNDMAADLEATIGSVKGFSETVARSAESATASAEEVRNAGEDVSQSVQEISDGVDDQSRSLTELSSELDDLSATIEEIASSSQEVATTSRQAATRGESGRSAAKEAIEEMGEIETRAEETAMAVERLNAEMEEVGEIVELIDGIAGQISTLALNASIEAARAGEAGRGFAVVAEEVKKLAGETREATTTIEARIDELGARADQSAADVRRMREGIATGTETVEGAATALAEIVDAVTDANTGIQDIDDATDEQASSTLEVASMVQNVTATSEQVNRESQTVAAAAEEQAASLSEVTQNTTRLAARASELDRALSEFTIGEVEDGTRFDEGRHESLDDGTVGEHPADEESTPADD